MKKFKKISDLKPGEKKPPREPRAPLEPETIATIKFAVVWGIIAIVGLFLIWRYQADISAFLDKIAGVFK